MSTQVVRQHQRGAGLRAAAVRHDVPARLALQPLRQRPPRPAGPRAQRRTTRSTSAEVGDVMSAQILAVMAAEPPGPHHVAVPRRGRGDHRHHVLGQPAELRHGRLLRRRALLLGLPERPGHRRRLHVGGVVPRHLRRDRALRLRRLPLLDRLPGRLAGGAAAGRGDAAQLRPLHDGRPAGLPDAPASGADGGGDLDRGGVDLLPARADGRRRRPGLAAARHRQPGDDQPDHLRGRHPDGLLRDRRRHEGHHLGADRQGRAADGRLRADRGPGARRVQLQPLRPARQPPPATAARARPSSSPA